MQTEWTDCLADNPVEDSNLPESSKGIVNLESLAVLHLQGHGAMEFLQGYVTCDMQKLSSTQALFAAICDIKGRAIASLYILEMNEQVCLILHKSVLSLVTKHFQKYLMFSPCELSDLNHEVVVLGRMEGEISPPSNTSEPLSVKQISGAAIISFNDTQNRTMLICEPQYAIHLWSEKHNHLDERYWRLADLKAGRIMVTEDISQKYLPQTLNMSGENTAIDFNKGCYLGQEIIARVEHRGMVKRHLMIFQWQVDPDKKTSPQKPSVNHQSADKPIDSPKFGDELYIASLSPNANDAETTTLLGTVVQTSEIIPGRGWIAAVCKTTVSLEDAARIFVNNIPLIHASF